MAGIVILTLNELLLTMHTVLFDSVSSLRAISIILTVFSPERTDHRADGFRRVVAPAPSSCMPVARRTPALQRRPFAARALLLAI